MLRFLWRQGRSVLTGDVVVMKSFLSEKYGFKFWFYVLRQIVLLFIVCFFTFILCTEDFGTRLDIPVIWILGLAGAVYLFIHGVFYLWSMIKRDT